MQSHPAGIMEYGYLQGAEHVVICIATRRVPRLGVSSGGVSTRYVGRERAG